MIWNRKEKEEREKLYKRYEEHKKEMIENDREFLQKTIVYLGLSKAYIELCEGLDITDPFYKQLKLEEEKSR